MISLFFNDTATTEIYTNCPTLSLPGALPIGRVDARRTRCRRRHPRDLLAPQRHPHPHPQPPGGRRRTPGGACSRPPVAPPPHLVPALRAHRGPAQIGRAHV